MDWQAFLISLFLAGMMPWAFFFPGCLCCGTCTHCTSSRPSQVQIVISGVIQGTDCDLATCSQVDGTWILDAIAQIGVGNCFWSYTFPSTICDYPGIFLTLRAGNMTVDVAEDITNLLNWTSAAAGFDDCANWSSFNVPFDTASTELGCDATASTCELTAL